MTTNNLLKNLSETISALERRTMRDQTRLEALRQAQMVLQGTSTLEPATEAKSARQSRRNTRREAWTASKRREASERMKEIWKERKAQRYSRLAN
jgi:hypothetical protein